MMLLYQFLFILREMKCAGKARPKPHTGFDFFGGGGLLYSLPTLILSERENNVNEKCGPAKVSGRLVTGMGGR
jgi:hypothetical protein